jgi:hypothetical protein
MRTRTHHQMAYNFEKLTTGTSIWYTQTFIRVFHGSQVWMVVRIRAAAAHLRAKMTRLHIYMVHILTHILKYAYSIFVFVTISV